MAAAQGRDGVHHVVGVGNIRVILTHDDDGWFAQGIEIDYGAQGSTIEDAKANFQTGLTATIEAHLTMFGTIDRIVRVVPQRVYAELLHDKTASYHLFSEISFDEINRSMAARLPFQGIDFYKSRAA